MFESARIREKTRRDAEELARSLSGQSLETVGGNKPGRLPPTTPQNRKLTRGAKIIAGYVFLMSYNSAVLKAWRTTASSRTFLTRLGPGAILPFAIAATGLAGSILLFRRKRLAKPAFLLWSALVITSTWIGQGAISFDSWSDRLISGALIAGVFLLINREVDRNVGDAEENDE